MAENILPKIPLIEDTSEELRAKSTSTLIDIKDNMMAFGQKFFGVQSARDRTLQEHYEQEAMKTDRQTKFLKNISSPIKTRFTKMKEKLSIAYDKWIVKGKFFKKALGSLRSIASRGGFWFFRLLKLLFLLAIFDPKGKFLSSILRFLTKILVWVIRIIAKNLPTLIMTMVKLVTEIIPALLKEVINAVFQALSDMFINWAKRIEKESPFLAKVLRFIGELFGKDGLLRKFFVAIAGAFPIIFAIMGVIAIGAKLLGPIMLLAKVLKFLIFKAIIPFFGALKALALFLLANPIVAVIAGIIIAFIAILKWGDKIQKWIDDTFGKDSIFSTVFRFIHSVVKTVWKFIKSVFGAFITFFKDIKRVGLGKALLNLGKNLLKAIWGLVKGLAKALWGLVKGIGKAIWGGIKSLGKSIAGWAKGKWAEAKRNWAIAKAKAKELARKGAAKVSSFLEKNFGISKKTQKRILAKAKGFKDKFASQMSKVWQTAKDLFSGKLNIRQRAKAFRDKLINRLMGAIRGFGTRIRNAFKKIWFGIRKVVHGFTSWMGQLTVSELTTTGGIRKISERARVASLVKLARERPEVLRTAVEKAGIKGVSKQLIEGAVRLDKGSLQQLAKLVPESKQVAVEEKIFQVGELGQFRSSPTRSKKKSGGRDKS